MATACPSGSLICSNVESKDKEILAIANATFDSSFRNGIGATTQVQVLSKQAIAAASLGRADAVRYLIPNQFRGLAAERPTAYKGGGALANRMMLREGPQALDAERLGRASEALHLALLQSNPSVAPKATNCTTYFRRGRKSGTDVSVWQRAAHSQSVRPAAGARLNMSLSNRKPAASARYETPSMARQCCTGTGAKPKS